MLDQPLTPCHSAGYGHVPRPFDIGASNGMRPLHYTTRQAIAEWTVLSGCGLRGSRAPAGLGVPLIGGPFHEPDFIS